MSQNQANQITKTVLSETGILLSKAQKLRVLILAKSQAGRKFEVLEAAYLVSIYTSIE